MSVGRSCCKVFTVSLVPVTVFILSLIFFGGIILLPALYAELAQKEQYGIVIDAGSSHSQVYLYSWGASLFNTTGRVKQVAQCRPLGGGISSYTHNANMSGKSLRACVQGVLKEVPESYKKKKKIDVWLGATAGMRILKLEEENLTHEIMHSVRSTLKSLNTRPHARIINGSEEGGAGWISTNYIENKLRKNYPKKRDLDSAPTIGALDMGGASLEIAFQPSSEGFNHSFSTSLFGQNFNIFSRSFLCFGLNEAFRRTLAYHVMENDYPESNSINHPCLLSGSSITRNMSFLFDNHTCTKDMAPPPADYVYNDTTNIVFTGTSNFSGCLDLMKRAMNFSRCFSNGSMTECANDVPAIAKKTFMGFSEFKYIMDFLHYKEINRSALAEFNKSVVSHCNSSWATVFKKYNKTSTLEFINESCFEVLYLSYVLQEGFGFNESATGWNVYFKTEVNDINTGWTLGYMLDQTNGLKEKPYHTVYPYSSADLIVGMLVLTILTVVFVIFFVFTFSACRKALRPITTGYTNIS